MGVVADYLSSKGCIVKQSGATQFHTHCFYCGEESNERGRLYFQDDSTVEPPGLFTCFLCGERGAYNKLRKHFKDKPIDSDETDFSQSKLQLLEAANTFFQENLSAEAIDYLLDERGLTAEVMDAHRFGFDPGGLFTFLKSKGFSKDQMMDSGLVRKDGRGFLEGCITIPYITSGHVVGIRGKKIGGKYLTPPGTPARLFNTDSLFGAEQAVVCEGEFDALMMEQLGYAAVGVPGANVWQDKWDSWVSDVKKLLVCFDNDQAGEAGAEKLAAKFHDRVTIVKLPEGDWSDISDWVNAGHGAEDFEFIAKRSRGGLLLSVHDAYEQWLEVDGNPDLEGIKIGFNIIDEAIKPGITPGQVFVLLAKTGVGKSIAAMNIFHRMRMTQPDKKILFLSLELTRGEWFERAHRIHNFYEPGVSVKDTIDFYGDSLWLVDKNRVTQKELENVIYQFSDVAGQVPDLTVVDYLGYFARSFRGEEYERTTAAIMACKEIGKSVGTSLFIPSQVGRGTEVGEEIELNSAKGSGGVEETADYLAGIWNPDQRKGVERGERTNKITFKVLKSRRGGTGVQCELQFAPATLALVARGEKLYDRAVAEHRMVLAKDTYPQVVERHRTGDMTIGRGPSGRFNIK